MPGFFRMFFASLLALVIFSLICFFLFIAIISGLAKSDKPVVHANSVLYLDLNHLYLEQRVENPLASVASMTETDLPGIYDVVRLIHKAAGDEDIKGIYIRTGISFNGFAASEEIRNALVEFKRSKKFIISYGDILDQRSYHVANVAEKMYLNPQGFIDWRGFSTTIMFLEGTLKKLDIEPQIFYAGKFKSATEPFRASKMTDENRLQTSEWLGDIYAHFLVTSSGARNIDTASLHRMANENTIRTPQDAVNNKLIDGVKYDDEVRDEIRQRLGIEKDRSIHFISVTDYAQSGVLRDNTGERIALIYAQGAIIDGDGGEGQIGSADYTKLIRRARMDRNIKAIVFRVNSGGGSALASENIWRELSLAKREKPVVVSFGDVAASGGYYISCAADSIFASPTTITGSIGVFGILPNMKGFFGNKLGITFDGVKTGPYADLGAVYRPLSESEKQFMQQSIDGIYATFKQRVADGRKKSVEMIDSIAQGRVWSGKKGLEISLVDRFGGLHDAVQCAARMAKLTDYRLREYPEVKNLFQFLFGESDKSISQQTMRKQLGDENYKVYRELIRIREMSEGAQARLPFEFFLQ